MPHAQGCRAVSRPSLYLAMWSYCPGCENMVKDKVMEAAPTCPDCGHARERYGTHVVNGSRACPADGFIENPRCPKCERVMGLATITLGGRRPTKAWWHCGVCNVRVEV